MLLKFKTFCAEWALHSHLGFSETAETHLTEGKGSSVNAEVIAGRSTMRMLALSGHAALPSCDCRPTRLFHVTFVFTLYKNNFVKVMRAN